VVGKKGFESTRRKEFMTGGAKRLYTEGYNKVKSSLTLHEGITLF
jgi:hypothetical protein